MPSSQSEGISIYNNCSELHSGYFEIHFVANSIPLVNPNHPFSELYFFQPVPGCIFTVLHGTLKLLSMEEGKNELLVIRLVMSDRSKYQKQLWPLTPIRKARPGPGMVSQPHIIVTAAACAFIAYLPFPIRLN
jgi:hypothetical protein